MKTSYGTKIISLALSLCMIFSMLPTAALANEPNDPVAGLAHSCPHHPEHTEVCGYAEAVEAADCTHQCSENPGCVTASCVHVAHDDTCGYIEGRETQPCTFVCEKCTRQILYSDMELAFSQTSGLVSEAAGRQTVALTRSGSTAEALSVTVLVYDNSANYGEDYQIYYGETLVAKNEGSTSIYDAFRDQGELTSGALFDLNTAMVQMEELQSGQEQENVSAADMLAQLDGLGVQAAAIDVTFAAGVDAVSLTIEILNDAIGEYQETFLLAALDAEGKVVETAQQVFAIADDDEPAPSVSVFFDCAAELELDPESGEAELVFRRTGDLATATLTVLCQNGEPMGWVDFAPWQEFQTVWVLEAGTYTLLDSDGAPLEGQQVTVCDNRPVETIVPEGADPVLDALPEEYAAMPRSLRAISTSWLPAWATGTASSDEYSAIILGSTSNNLFKKGGNTSKGSASFYVDSYNIHDLNTSGTGSRLNTGYLFLDSNANYDFTGVEAISSTVYASGVDKNADFCIGVSGTTRETVRVTAAGKAELTCKLPDKFQGSKYIYYGNTDPDKGSGGTHMYVPNGMKLNLRQYRFIIEDSTQYVTALNYTGGSEPGDHAPTINSTKKYQMMTINSKTYGANKTVDIVYSCDSQYPARLVGYKLRNYQDGKTSDIISLTGGGDGTGGTASITFDAAFLKKYESAYCAKTSVNGVEAWTFHVIPVYEKIPVDSYEIWDSVEGEVQLVSTGTLYRGDIAVFEDKTTDSTLSGVWYQAKGATGDTIKEQAVSQTHYGSATSQFQVNLLYNRYVFQGVYSADAAQLLVYYADEASSRGKLDKTGQVVSPDEYVMGDYVPLTATANDGYVTRWESAGRYFYGNTFYYQLDGNPDHNTVSVDFVAADTVTDSALTGILYQAETELRLGNSSYVPMANTQLTIVADEIYQVTTDENGGFSIPGFAGVAGGIYSVAVNYPSAIGYTTFTYLGNTSDSYELKLPQFATGTPYPDKVTATVNGIGSSQNMLTLTSGGVLGASVRVYVPPKNHEITAVNVYFLTADQIAAGSTTGLTAYPATYTSTSGDYQVWTVSDISADNLTSGTLLYVTVDASKTIYGNGTETATTIASGLVNGGYQLTTPNVDTTVSVIYDVPETPGLQNAPSIDLSKLNIPVLGNLDFSLSSKTGGFFTQRTDSAGNLTLICGSTYLADFAAGPVSEKYAAKQKTKEAVAAKKDSTSLSDQPTGAANPGVAAAIPGDTMSGSGSASNKTKAPSNWEFSPAFLFKITLSPGTEDPTRTYASAYEMALGVDAFYKRNIPFNVYGVPLYVGLTFTTEAYWDLQVAFKDDKMPLDDIGEALYALGSVDAGDIVASADSFIAAPVMQFGAKGGVGYNGFLSLFLEAVVNAPFLISVAPTLDAAAKLSFTVNAGADLVVFTGKIGETLSLDPFGNEELINDLTTIEGLAAASTASTMSLRSTAAGNESALPDVEELLNELTFSAMPRTVPLRRSALSSGTVASSTFKNTGIHLLQLNENTIMAFFLMDNRNEDTLNYLTAAYAVSVNGGKTWGNVTYVSDNTQQPNTSLQYDINLFQLEDRTLVTWSEANFDQLLKLENMDVNSLTPAQISKFMNAMNLKGRFFDSRTGQPMGDAFTIAENPTVACSAIDAVQNGDTVYVYYQRNVFPTGNDGSENVTLSDLLATERTIALARADVSDSANWISTTVRAMSENGQEYRITDVEPFVHDGVMGEILVLDRDGKLAEWNETTGVWDLSNEDRQLYLRTYDFAADGTPEPTALMAITSAQVCAQSPEVVSSGNYLHLFWNQNGNVVYFSDFVATSTDSEDTQKAAYVLKNADGTVVQQNTNSYSAYDIASDESFHIGTTFTASMDETGNVLLSWVATDTEDTDLLPTEEVYGVMLETITNAEAASRSGGEVTKGNETVYQLYAKGAPVALTDENSLIGALDSLCMDSSSFLLAFTKLNNEMRSAVTAADVLTVRSEYEPKLEIASVSAPQYPMPGSDMTVYVTVENKGLGTAETVTVTASGVGNGSAIEIDKLQSGCSTTVELTVAVPEDFQSSTTLNVTAKTGSASASGSAEILYGPFFTICEMPVMSPVAGTSDCWTETYVYNAGNAAGTPTLTFTNDLFAVNDTSKTYTYTLEESIVPGGTAKLSYLLENTTLNAEQASMLTVSSGEGADQRIQGRMPTILVSKTSTVAPDVPDTPPSSDNSDSASVTYTPVVESTKHGTISVSPKSVEAGNKVTITPIPNAGYQVDKVTVTNRGGREIKVTDNGNGTYCFTQPVGKVTISVTFAASEAGTTTRFTDVPDDVYYADAVGWAVKNGITAGTSATTFSPDAACTRAQAVTFLWRAAGSPEPENDVMPFTDVAAGAYYYDAVLWAMEQGITSGTSATAFSPNAVCTRAQIVTFLWRSEESPAAITAAPFIDVPTDAYYAKAILWAVENEITAGTSATTFSPNNNCTRAQIVTFLWRCFQ